MHPLPRMGEGVLPNGNPWPTRRFDGEFRLDKDLPRFCLGGLHLPKNPDLDIIGPSGAGIPFGGSAQVIL